MPRFTRRSWLSLAAAAVPAGVFSAPVSTQSVRRPIVINGRRYLHYDVFTDQPLAGNQLAVFTETTGLTAAQMQAMTRETKFSECTFLQPAEVAGTDVRLRIFGAANEMQFAGHPVIGSSFALADDGVIAPGRREFTFGLGIGPTLVELEWAAKGANNAEQGRLRFAWMTPQKPVFGPTLDAPGPWRRRYAARTFHLLHRGWRGRRHRYSRMMGAMRIRRPSPRAGGSRSRLRSRDVVPGEAGRRAGSAEGIGVQSVSNPWLHSF